MLKVTVTKDGQTMSLSDNQRYALASVAGITPPKASVNTSPLATTDGSVFNGSRLNNRNVVLTICPQGKVEANRVALYSFFKSKKQVRIDFKTESRETYVEGWVESIDGDLFAALQQIQVSIICTYPYLLDVNAVVTNFQNGEATVQNASDDEVGFITEFTASGAVEGITLQNAANGQTFSVACSLISGDKLIINTKRGEKAVTLIRDGQSSSVINQMDVDSDWIQLEVGQNNLTFTCDSGAANLAAAVTLRQIYEGV